MFVVAMALGTAWAVRGKFGHEQGAAWAGAIGAMSVLLVAKRGDWYDKIFTVALAAAIGWGAGGMISYGVVVGYGRGEDFMNVYYGMLMLFVIGGLYGFLGGGLFGLALMDSKEVSIKWHALIAEMVAMGLLSYVFLIDQLEWLMTPPRSEAWAACFGASIAVGWYIFRNRLTSVLKVAVCTALGAGFGFAFGNFLQVLGAGSALPFNFWNIMEYSIGFFGGLGMAYGTLTTTWPVQSPAVEKKNNFIPIFILMVFIPFIIWQQSFVPDKLAFILTQGGDEQIIIFFQWISMLAILASILIVFVKYNRAPYDVSSVKIVFGLYLGTYTFLSFLQTGIYVHPIEQYLYIVNIVIVLCAVPYMRNSMEVRESSPQNWLKAFLLTLGVLAILAIVAIHSHEELKGSQIRFK